MTTDDTEPAPAEPEQTRTRRRSSRAAGPVGEPATAAAGTVRIAVSGSAATRPALLAGPPPRRTANSRLAGLVAGVAGLTLTAVLGGLVAVLLHQQRQADAALERDQRFVDTAAQAVINMYSYTPDTINEQVDRFVAGTSGPLRDTMSGNAENLKALLRETKRSSEAVINAAALEDVDEISSNASVLVAMRATATDVDGINSPSQPYALRLIVHEDDDGNMTAYDLKWPDGSR